MSARVFMVGVEAVTLDIVPLLRFMSDQGRLEDTMYLTMFAMEEAPSTPRCSAAGSTRWAWTRRRSTTWCGRQAAVAALGERRTGVFDVRASPG